MKKLQCNKGWLQQCLHWPVVNSLPCLETLCPRNTWLCVPRWLCRWLRRWRVQRYHGWKTFKTFRETLQLFITTSIQLALKNYQSWDVLLLTSSGQIALQTHSLTWWRSSPSLETPGSPWFDQKVRRFAASGGLKESEEIVSHDGRVLQRDVHNEVTMPESPDWMPPQYTVQFCGLDWFTTSSNLSCFEPSERVKKIKQNHSHVGASKIYFDTKHCHTVADKLTTTG